MTGTKLVRTMVRRAYTGDQRGVAQGGEVAVDFRWQTDGGVEWDSVRLFPTLGFALDHLSWLYAEQRQKEQ